MIAHLKELKILRAVIDEKTWIDIVLITLLEFFKVLALATLRVEDFVSLAEFLKGL